MPYQNPFYLTSDEMLAETLAPKVEAFFKANKGTRQFSLAEIKAGIGADGANLNKKVLFLALLRLGFISEDGA